MAKEATVHTAEVAVAAGDKAAIAKLGAADFWIRTNSGKKFYPLRPDLNQYDIVDIAHSLSYNNRYNGHLDFPESVGQHSVLVAEQVLRMFDEDVDMWEDTELGSNEWMRMRAILGLQALLHDATEAFMPDMPSPIKLCLPDFMAMEERIAESIMVSFDLPVEEPAIVKEVDKGIRGSEIKHLFTVLKGDDVWAEDIYKVEVISWNPIYTQKRFLALFNELEAHRYR